jgi:hypothetical protein
MHGPSGIGTGRRDLPESALVNGDNSWKVWSATTQEDVQRAGALEHDVFVAEGFCPASEECVVEDYAALDGQSRWYLAADGRPSPAGVLRLMEQGPLPVPAVAHFALDPAAADLLKQHRYREVGTLAVIEQHRGSDIALHLYREAFCDSVVEGMTAWLAVVEDWLLAHLRAFGFPFNPIGGSREYMGGTCLPVLMLFADVRSALQTADPRLYSWITRGLLDQAPV